MKKPLIIEIIFIIIHLFLQLFVLKKFYVLESCYIYIGVFFLLPRITSPITSLLISFLTGSIVGIFYDGIGRHSAISLISMYVIIFLGKTLNIKALNEGFITLIVYIVVIVSFHYSILVVLDEGYSTYRLIVNISATSIIISTLHYSFHKRKR